MQNQANRMWYFYWIAYAAINWFAQLKSIWVKPVNSYNPERWDDFHRASG